jgi:5-methylcytosine-specific restriction endonuclease McrA
MKSTISENLRDYVAERDSYTCILCSRPGSDLHHVKPRSQGGRDVIWNLVSVCRVHHLILHGQRVRGEALGMAEARQTVLEYVSDYYAEEIERGRVRWPGG